MHTMDNKFAVGCFAIAFLGLTLDYIFNVGKINDKLSDVNIREFVLERRLRLAFSESD